MKAKKKKTATVKQTAKLHFESVGPGHQAEVNDNIKFHASIMMLAFGALTKSKEELVELWQNPDNQEAHMQFVDQMRSTKKWVKRFDKAMGAAVIRMLVAASASAVREKKAA